MKSAIRLICIALVHLQVVAMHETHAVDEIAKALAESLQESMNRALQDPINAENVIQIFDFEETLNSLAAQLPADMAARLQETLDRIKEKARAYRALEEKKRTAREAKEKRRAEARAAKLTDRLPEEVQVKRAGKKSKPKPEEQHYHDKSTVPVEQKRQEETVHRAPAEAAGKLSTEMPTTPTGIAGAIANRFGPDTQGRDEMLGKLSHLAEQELESASMASAAGPARPVDQPANPDFEIMTPEDLKGYLSSLMREEQVAVIEHILDQSDLKAKFSAMLQTHFQPQLVAASTAHRLTKQHG